MYIQTTVLMQESNQEKYAVAGLDDCITCVFDSKEGAQKRAQKWAKEGHSRHRIICKFATVEEIVKAIDSEVQSLTEYDKKFNSPKSGLEAHNLKGVKEIFLSR